MLELDPRLLCSEAPVYGTFVGVTLGFPRTHFLGKRLLVGEALFLTLAGEHRELYLGHVQPRAVLWGVMNLQPLQQTPSFSRGERLIQSGRGMGVEVVHYQNDLQGLRVVQIYKLLYAVCPLELRSPLGNADVTPAGEGLTDDEEVSRPVALVLVVVVAGCPSRLGSERLPYLTYELLTLLIQAHLWTAGIVGTGVDLKHILHAPDEGGILLWWDGPLPLEPGLYGTFLRVRRTNSQRWALLRTPAPRNARPEDARSSAFCPSEALSRPERSDAPPALHRASSVWWPWACGGPALPPTPPRRTSRAPERQSSG